MMYPYCIPVDKIKLWKSLRRRGIPNWVDRPLIPKLHCIYNNKSGNTNKGIGVMTMNKRKPKTVMKIDRVRKSRYQKVLLYWLPKPYGSI